MFHSHPAEKPGGRPFNNHRGCGGPADRCGEVSSRPRRIRIKKINNGSLYNVLADLKRQRREKWLKKGINEIPDWVFCNREGNLIDMYNIKNRHFRKSLEKAGLRRIRFHDLRHTFATLLLQNGESLAYVKNQLLGHSSIRMTGDVYGHLVPGANRQAVNKLPSLDTSTPVDLPAKASHK